MGLIKCPEEAVTYVKAIRKKQEEGEEEMKNEEEMKKDNKVTRLDSWFPPLERTGQRSRTGEGTSTPGGDEPPAGPL